MNTWENGRTCGGIRSRDCNVRGFVGNIWKPEHLEASLLLESVLGAYFVCLGFWNMLTASCLIVDRGHASSFLKIDHFNLALDFRFLFLFETYFKKVGRWLGSCVFLWWLDKINNNKFSCFVNYAEKTKSNSRLICLELSYS